MALGRQKVPHPCLKGLFLASFSFHVQRQKAIDFTKSTAKLSVTCAHVIRIRCCRVSPREQHRLHIPKQFLSSEIYSQIYTNHI